MFLIFFIGLVFEKHLQQSIKISIKIIYNETLEQRTRHVIKINFVTLIVISLSTLKKFWLNTHFDIDLLPRFYYNYYMILLWCKF